MKRIGTIAAVAGTLMLTFGVGTASAAGGATRICPSSGSCSVGTGFFPGGTISIDADAYKVPAGADETLQWSLQGAPGCTTTFTVNDPPRSWVCNNVAPGTYSLVARTGSLRTYHWDIGVRW